MDVGTICLKPVFELLKEQCTSEEYVETLDLIFKMLNNNNEAAKKANTDLIYTEGGKYIELLLELLEHEYDNVGVMSIQLLSEIHKNNNESFEEAIQNCPDGKLILIYIYIISFFIYYFFTCIFIRY